MVTTITNAVLKWTVFVTMVRVNQFVIQMSITMLLLVTCLKPNGFQRLVRHQRGLGQHANFAVSRNFTFTFGYSQCPHELVLIVITNLHEQGFMQT